MGIIFSIIGAVAGLSGMILGIIGFLHNRIKSVTTYLEYTRELEFIEARSLIWDLRDYDPESINKDRKNPIKSKM